MFEGLVYPVTRKFFNVTPLRKMGFGGLLAAIAFIMAGLLQVNYIVFILFNFFLNKMNFS